MPNCMKKTLLSLILFCCCLAGFAQDPVEMMVLMKAQYDRTQLCRQAWTSGRWITMTTKASIS